MQIFRAHVLVCGGTGCTSGGSPQIRARLEEELAKNGLDKEVNLVLQAVMACVKWARW